MTMRAVCASSHGGAAQLGVAYQPHTAPLDIGEFTTRKPRTGPVPFTPAQKAVHGSILEVQRTVYKRTHGNNVDATRVGTQGDHFTDGEVGPVTRPISQEPLPSCSWMRSNRPAMRFSAGRHRRRGKQAMRALPVFLLREQSEHFRSI